MKWNTIVLLVLVLIAAVLAAGPAVAGKKSGAPLPATGKTIGGPGGATVDSIDNTLWEIKGGATRDICVTLKNEASVSSRIEVNSAILEVPPGETRTLCGEGKTRFWSNCFDEACRIQWRVDLM